MAEGRRDVAYQADWTRNLHHRADPNRVNGPAAPPRPMSARREPAIPQASAPPLARSAASQPSYYNLSFLKAPVWKWQIASYFFCGGLSAGAYVLSRMAERAGGEKYRDMSRMGAYLAMAALVPCPPLLIADLGDPKRFHHMLRLWKPGTPMNLGTWSIVAYSGMAAYEIVRQYLQDRAGRIGAAERGKLLKLMNNGVLLAVHDAAGVPFALMVAGYTGVLLSCTSNPLWSRNPWLGPLFTASALSTGAEAISLALDLAAESGRPTSASHSILRKVDTLAHLTEIGCLAGFLRFAGDKANSLRQGRQSTHHHFSLRAIVAAELLKLVPFGGALRKPIRMLSSALGLAAGFALRWSMVHGGREAAEDPHAARLVSQPQAESAARDSFLGKPQRAGA